MAGVDKGKDFISDIINLIPPEKIVLLLSSPLIIDRIKNDDLKSVKLENIDWDVAVDASFKYGLSGIIFYNLKQSGLIDILPEEDMLKLQHLYHSNAARNALIKQILITISQLFTQYGKSFLLLQGTALINGIYPQAAMRYLSDIDIMIREEDVEDVDKILGENGFTATTFPGNVEWCLENINHLPHYYYPGFNSPIEVHFKTAETFSGTVDNSDWIWEDIPAINENNLKAPSPENLLLSISAHVAKKSHIADLRFIPRHCCDVYSVIRNFNDSLDRKKLFERASELNLTEPLSYSLTMCSFLFSSEIISELTKESQALASASSAKLSETVTKTLLCENTEEILLDGWLAFFNKPGILGKMLFFLSHIFPRPKKMKDIYGNDAAGLKLIAYYIYRPFFLINRFSLTRIKVTSKVANARKNE